MIAFVLVRNNNNGLPVKYCILLHIAWFLKSIHISSKVRLTIIRFLMERVRLCVICVLFLLLLGRGDTFPERGEVTAVCLSPGQYLWARKGKASPSFPSQQSSKHKTSQGPTLPPSFGVKTLKVKKVHIVAISACHVKDKQFVLLRIGGVLLACYEGCETCKLIQEYEL